MTNDSSNTSNGDSTVKAPAPKTWYDERSGEVFLETPILSYKIDTNRNVYVRKDYKKHIDKEQKSDEENDGDDNEDLEYKRFEQLPRGYDRWEKQNILKATYEATLNDLPQHVIQKSKKNA